jgi:hypothetical protein
MGDNSAPAAAWFLAVEQRFWRDRLYRIYVGKDFIAGARIAGIVYDEMSFMLTGAGAHWLTRGLLAGWKKRKFAERKAREAFYDGINPAEQDLRAFDARNFHYSANEIVRLGFRFNNSSEIASATGVILLTTFAGPTRTLTVIDYIEPAAVIELLQSLDPRLEIEGQLGYASIRHREQAVARDHALNGGICCILIGALAGVAWAFGFWPGFGGLQVAIALPLYGLWSLRRFSRMPKATAAN